MNLTDAVAEALLRTMMECVPEVLKDPENYRYRAQIMWGGSIAHNDLTGCGRIGDWATHQLEHELSGMFDVTHGAGLAAVWPSWARYVYKECMPRFVRYAIKVMGVKDEGQGDEQIALEGIAKMEEFYRSIGMPTNMRELGITPTEEQILEMARSCREACGGKQGSAKVLYEEDMANIYRMAL